MSARRKKTALEYDAEVLQTASAATPGRRVSKPPHRPDADDEPTATTATTPRRRTASSKKKTNASGAAASTPKSSAKKKSRVSRASVEAAESDNAVPATSTTTAKQSLSARLEAIIPPDARSVDVQQVVRLGGLPGASPSPSPSPSPNGWEYDEAHEDDDGPRGYLTQKGLQTLKEYKSGEGSRACSSKEDERSTLWWCMRLRAPSR